MPVPGSIANNHEDVSGDTSKVVCAKSSSDIGEANFTCSQEQRGGVKAARPHRLTVGKDRLFLIKQNRNYPILTNGGSPSSPCLKTGASGEGIW